MTDKRDVTEGIIARIRIAMRGGSVNGTAKRAGISRGTLQSILDRGVTPRVDTLIKLIDCFSLDANWVLFGYGERQRDEPVLAPMTQIPLLKAEMIFAGIPADTRLTSLVSVRMPRVLVGDADDLYAFAVTGDSMHPEVDDEDYVVFNIMDNDPEACPGALMVLNLPQKRGVVIKRVEIRGKTIALMSTNPSYEDLVFPRREIHPNAIIGRVVYRLKPDGHFAIVAD